jgi:hypothetical protein
MITFIPAAQLCVIRQGQRDVVIDVIAAYNKDGRAEHYNVTRSEPPVRLVSRRQVEGARKLE